MKTKKQATRKCYLSPDRLEDLWRELPETKGNSAILKQMRKHMKVVEELKEEMKLQQREVQACKDKLWNIICQDWTAAEIADSMISTVERRVNSVLGTNMKVEG